MSDNRLHADGTQVLPDLNWLLVRETVDVTGCAPELGHCHTTRRERCMNMASHACSASTNVANGEPGTVMAGLLLYRERQEATNPGLP